MEESLKKTKTINRLHGIACHWFNGNNEIEREIFHSRELIPYELINNTPENLILNRINDWMLDEKRDKHWIKQGIEVLHRDNLKQKMIVSKVIRKPFTMKVD